MIAMTLSLGCLSLSAVVFGYTLGIRAQKKSRNPFEHDVTLVVEDHMNVEYQPQTNEVIISTKAGASTTQAEVV